MSSEPEALRLARKLVHGPWSSWIEHADDLRATAAELRRLHSEREADRAAMREALAALQFSLNFVGRPDRRIDAAIEKLKARTA